MPWQKSNGILLSHIDAQMLSIVVVILAIFRRKTGHPPGLSPISREDKVALTLDPPWISGIVAMDCGSLAPLL